MIDNNSQVRKTKNILIIGNQNSTHSINRKITQNLTTELQYQHVQKRKLKTQLTTQLNINCYLIDLFLPEVGAEAQTLAYLCRGQAAHHGTRDVLRHLERKELQVGCCESGVTTRF